MNMKANAKKQNKKVWKELKTQKEEFQKIVSILNRFYSQNPNFEEKTSSQKFREELAVANQENVRIFIQKFGKYEFLIAAEIQKEEKLEKDTWIHIDGIQQEREEFRKSGTSDHPVFKLTCLTDLYRISEKCSDPVV
jgi:hypothetical protein